MTISFSSVFYLAQGCKTVFWSRNWSQNQPRFDFDYLSRIPANIGYLTIAELCAKLFFWKSLFCRLANRKKFIAFLALFTTYSSSSLFIHLSCFIHRTMQRILVRLNDVVFAKRQKKKVAMSMSIVK